jgi:undecaprenyl-phosphate 4-deoxy-4-formamido-L-arabinose transferase
MSDTNLGQVTHLSIVIPVYNGADTIGPVVEDCIRHLNHLDDLEIVLVNDGSRDNSDAVCKSLFENHPQHVVYLNLARNVGEHSAVIAGISHATGNGIAILDDDGQNPPEEVLKLIEKFNAGNDVVYGTPTRKEYNAFRNVGSKFNDKVATLLIGKPTEIYLSSFKIISRLVADYIVEQANPNPYIDSLIFQCTDRIAQTPVNQSERTSGTSNYTLRKLIHLWSNMMTTSSILPLRVATYAGLTFAFLGLVASMVTLIEYFFFSIEVRGYASILLGILVFSGIQLFSLGMLGEYVGRLFQNSQLSNFVIRDLHKKRS